MVNAKYSPLPMTDQAVRNTLVARVARAGVVSKHETRANFEAN